MKFRSKNLLVTGGAGFIGSNFISYFLNKYDHTNIINLDLLTYAGNLDNTSSFKNHPKYKFIKGDICNTKLINEIFNDYKIDGVINFAAETHVDNSIKNPDVFIRTNINGVFNLLNIAYKFWMNKPFKVKDKYSLAKFHQISTDEVYGSIENGSFTEDSRYSPNSPYSASKASADMLIRSFNKTYGLNTTISVCSNNFGSNQNEEKFIPKIIKSYKSGDYIPVYGNGENFRNWIYVNDHCNAIDIIFNDGKNGELYNVGSDFECDNNFLVKKIIEFVNQFGIKSKSRIKYVKDRYGHDKRYSLNCSKIKSNLYWKQKYNFESALKTYISTLI